MSVPTSGEVFAKLLEHMREAQDCCAMLSHLEGLNDQPVRSRGWLSIEEQLKKFIHYTTLLAQGKLQ
jgi:hypothetical protein